MQGTLAGFVAIGQMPTSQARTMVVVVVVGHDNGLGQIVDIDDALGGIGDVFTGSEHGMSPEKKGRTGSVDKLGQDVVYISSNLRRLDIRTLLQNPFVVIKRLTGF
jgi:hypothetical protein